MSASISLGNQADVCESDVLRFLDDDEQTRSIALYLEGVSDGAGFVSALQDVATRPAHRGPEVRPLPARAGGGGVPHRLAGGFRRGLHRPVPSVRRGPRRRHRGALRLRQDPRDDAAADRQPGAHDVVVRGQLRPGRRRGLRARPGAAGAASRTSSTRSRTSTSRSGARSPTRWTWAACRWTASAPRSSSRTRASWPTSSCSCSAIPSEGADQLALELARYHEGEHLRGHLRRRRGRERAALDHAAGRRAGLPISGARDQGHRRQLLVRRAPPRRWRRGR